MKFDPPLMPAVLVKRYKRFLADVILEDGREVTAHCANSGAMIGVSNPGSRIWMQPSTNPKRKLQWSWILIEVDEDTRAGIDTGIPNRLVREALDGAAVPQLRAYPEIIPEQRYGEKSRVDFLLRGAGLPNAYVEVKNVHMRRVSGLAEFPDCVTARGTKHLQELTRVAERGDRAVLIYVVQMTGIRALSLAADLDPAYAAAAKVARAAGVDMICCLTDITPHGITISGQAPIFHD